MSDNSYFDDYYNPNSNEDPFYLPDHIAEHDANFNRRRYEQFVRSCLTRISVLYTSSLVHAMKCAFPELTEKYAREILYTMQSKNKLLLAPNDIVMTDAAYHDMVDDRFGDLLNRTGGYYVDPRLIDLNRTCAGKPVMECFKVVADMMPGSSRFLVSAPTTPWLIQFIMPKTNRLPARLFQVTYIVNGEEIPAGAIINTLQKFDNEDIRNRYRRIVILENSEAAGMMPKGCGITKILGLDPQDERGFKLLKSYTVEQAWNRFSN